MSDKSILLLAALCSFGVFAATTNIIDIATLAACGTGTVNEWTVNGIDSYSDKTSFRLNEKTEYLLSQTFPAKIREIVINVKSSSTTGRRLTFIPSVNGEFNTGYAAYCQYSPTKDTYIRQSLSFDNKIQCTAFKIMLASDEGGNTGWGVSYLAVITDDIPTFRAAESVVIDRLRASQATVRWKNSDLTVSNLVTVSEIKSIASSFTEYAAYDFELCVNTGSSDSQDKSSDLHTKYPEFTAEKLYYPASSTGVLRISSKDTNGRLTYCGITNYDGIAVQIRTSRYSGDNGSKIWVYYVDDNQQNVPIGNMELANGYSVGTIDLSATPAGKAINIGNLDGFKSNRRFLIDRISFVKDYIPESTTTNIVYTAMVNGGNEINVRALKNNTCYFASVVSFDKNGNRATPSVPVHFTTAGNSPSMLIRFR